MEANLVFDLGMNNGDDSDFYLSKGFTVVAVEPNTALCELAERRFASQIRDGKMYVVNKAISNVSGEIEFFENEQVTGWSTTHPDWLKARNQEGTTSRPLTVSAMTCQELLKEFGVPYYLKADIQGSELLCLEALLDFPNRPHAISISSGADAAGTRAMQLVRRSIELFSRLGYRKFQIVGQQSTGYQQCPFPAREGSYVDYRFPHGSTGLFGDELPGEWLDADQAVKTYKRIVTSYRFAGSSRSPHAWFRNLSNRTLKYYLDRLFTRGVDWYDTHVVREQE